MNPVPWLQMTNMISYQGLVRTFHSVQQAAWMSGYQHATNFSTAFRRRYGFSPGDLLKPC
ncbi:helix-turn-helix domain-containing protein [Citrobacter freundii]|uniref:helix-turn-helix domain-containing protein n=1 Tax=Citrobacter freundii TaxID=546 RepID=UPI003B42A3FC